MNRYLLLAVPLLLTACGGLGGAGPQAGFAAPPPPGAPLVAGNAGDPLIAQAMLPMSPEPTAGAIFQAGTGYSGLVTGTRARALGDMVTIILTEATTTSKSTQGRTQREGSFGITPPASGPLDFLNPEALKAAAEGTFTGGGNAIAAIYPNGTAEVVGEKQMMFSQGDEWVQFAGRIRLIDIDSDNRLASSQVANARIIYSGKGAVQQASRPGWLSRFFNLISPF
ncbi:MAG: flagellar basal body L-ring protein FlgH [Sphingomonadales bacterium]|nr:MAG: flagellar basal body L-ring protein FlgH [Sphingomonadales bacterium]